MTEMEDKTKPYVIPDHTSPWQIQDNLDLRYRRKVEKLSDPTLAVIASDINTKMERVGQNPTDWYDMGRKHGYDIDNWADWTDPIVEAIRDERTTITVADMEEFATEILTAALPGDPECGGCPDIVGWLKEKQ